MSSPFRLPRSPSPSLLAAVLVGGALGCADKAPPEVPDTAFGHCIYENRFSGSEECREFRGAGWTEEEARASCEGEGAQLVLGACPYEETQGACVMDGEADKVMQMVIEGGDPARCPNNERGCELFGGGAWVPGSVCGGEDVPDVDDLYDPNAPYYIPETLVCVEPLEGEPPGQGPDGKVCTWTQMSGCTEEGRRYEDYASCDVIVTQRPYGPVPPNDTLPLDDPRLADPAYASEVAWVRSQLDACACVCCHKTGVSPEGAAIFDTAASGNFVNTFTDWGIAFAARAFDSSLLGSYEAEQNNGFSRFVAGVPSNDEPRMKRFFEGELAHRGLTMADFADELPVPYVFYEQSIYEPGPCEDGEGVDESGIVRWSGGRARYLYVLEDTAANPGVPPNYDKPDGTLWRVDTVPPAIPMKTGEVVYGETPAGTKQVLPEGGPPTALVPGESYLLFAFADVGVPVTRCVFPFMP